MEQLSSDVQEIPAQLSAGPVAPQPQASSAVQPVSPQSCSTCGTTPSAASNVVLPPSWIYAIGHIEPRFPSLSLEKEFAQATGRGDTAGLTDRQALHAVLSKPESRYLVRQICWVMTIEGMDTYILRPKDAADYSLLVDAIRANPTPLDLDVVIGARVGIATPDMCNGLMVPIVVFDQVYSFDRTALVKAIPKPDKVTVKDFAPAAEELFDRLMQLADNAGATDEHRALNYLAMRYQAVYSKASECFAQNCSLTGVNVQLSPLSGTRKILEVIFTFTNRTTDVDEQYFVRVDVTDEFPFLVTKLSPYYNR